MTGPAIGTPRDLAGIREQARALATELPGPLRRITVRSGEEAIVIEWQQGAAPTAGAAAPAVSTADVTGDDPGAGPPLELVLSPMVGTFYRAPEPGAEPFVQVGDAIEAGRVVGIVEAMKLMNPIPAEVAGVVTDVLVANGETVEFGQPLIAVVPTS
jgi:acetyl-CoA carboxylase biotin carboxyl carrier protein